MSSIPYVMGSNRGWADICDINGIVYYSTNSDFVHVVGKANIIRCVKHATKFAIILSFVGRYMCARASNNHNQL